MLTQNQTRKQDRSADSRSEPLSRVRRRSADRITLVVVAATIIGALLRFIGIDWGFPLWLHPDERVIVAGAIDLAERNSFEPSVFARPDHFEIKLSYLVYVAYSYLVHGAPAETVFASSPATFLLISRSITAVIGTVMIPLGYLVGARYARIGGAAAAVLIALFPPFVEHSRYATPDIPLTMTFLTVMYLCIRYLETSRKSFVVAAAAAVAVAIAIKYPGVLASVMIAAVICVDAFRSRAPWRVLTRGGLAIVAVLAALFAISPVLFTNLNAVISAILLESRDTHLGADGLGWTGNMGFYMTAGLQGSGVLVLAAALGGVWWSMREWAAKSVPVWLGAAFGVLLSTLPLHWERWALPMHLTLLMFAALGVAWSYERLRRPTSVGPLLRRGWIGLVILVLLNLVLASFATTARFVATDTRETGRVAFAEAWIESTNAIFEGYSPLLPESGKFVFDRFVVKEGSLRLPHLPEDGPRPEYLVLSSDVGDRFMAEDKYVEPRAFYTLVREQLTEVLRIDAVPARTKSPLEIVSIVGSVEYLRAIVEGGNTGPSIIVYDLSDLAN